MDGLSENTISVIKQNDPNLPQYLDFKKLRKEGLEHIGNLSGKIWTDHNVHDPGITILEVLIYALMDLGYKTNLPFEDLITIQNNEGKDDNFLTPLEILTINPVTITDYRKLLLEIEGVKNAWLEPANQEIDLFIDQNANSLSCSRPSNNRIGQEYTSLFLNGLYKVYIEKDTNIIQDKAEQEQLIKEVKILLNKHRNLCEDFVDICILEPLGFGVCVEAELHTGYKVEIIYKEIIKRLKDFIQPEIKYYTLNELLDKGKSIDDIFAGRPYREESYGFVDTEEFEKLKRREEFHLSDIYNVILSIEGVRKVKKINLNKGANGTPSNNWVNGNNIPDEQVPVFSLENTCVDLYSNEGILKLDKKRIHNTFSFGKKVILPLNNLDTKVPLGIHREDLNEYYSIQNDFPVVYGIGDDGLPENSTPLRKIQALQLKGYLMFYDQMLANYTSQLSNIRSLFSLKPEKEKSEEEKHTYFNQAFDQDDIKKLHFDKLLRFYDEGQNNDEGSVLALPVLKNEEWEEALKKLKNNSRTEFTIGNYCEGKDGLVNLFTFSSPSIRSIYINQLIDSFFAQNYSIEILLDRYGYFFVLCPNIPNDVLIVGTKRYKSISEAKKEATNIVFISTIKESYHLTTNKSEDTSPDQHYFGVTYHPLSYMNLIQEITENKDEYITRRKQFLDHLLARFGEEFTDYTLLQYQNKLSTEELNENTINDQSLYINEFAEISRNRGKAFNYLEPSWNTNNVSGFEKRISLLSGMNNYKRHNICNFEVSPCYKLILKDWSGKTLLRSNRSYETKEEMYRVAKKVLSQLRDPKSYKQLEKSLNNFDAQIINRIFSETPADENIIETKYHYKQQLINSEDKEVIDSKNIKIKSVETANEKKAEFIKEIENQKFLPAAGEKRKYRLLSVDKKNCYLDTSALDMKPTTLISWKWHVNELTSKEKSTSSQVFEDYDEAWGHMIEEANLESYLTEHNIALKWRVKINKNISLVSSSCYPDAYKSITAWRQGKMLGSLSKNYTLEENGDSLVIQIKGEKGNIVAVSNKLNVKECNKETVIDECVKVFSDRKTQPVYDKEKEKFGFKIPVKENLSSLESYCVYDTKREALQTISEVFELGENKKHYLLSGDEGNPEYNFILKDKNDSFLALPPAHFEIASDRNKALTALTSFFKKNELPVSVNEEPRRYIWSLYENDKVVLKADEEFSSKAKAQANFDKRVIEEALKGTQKLYEPHLYNFKVEAIPVEFNFLYGKSNSENQFDPVFISNSIYKTKEDASKAYTDFVKKLPELKLKASKEKAYEFALYETGTVSPVAVQYKDEINNTKASLNNARELTTYVNSIYTVNEGPRDVFVIEEMAESQEGAFEWRFYKKNLPLAKSPFLCDEKASADELKTAICDIVPPINLKNCPPKDVVVHLKDKTGKYHYQICFKDDERNDFVLISYVGYNSCQEAEEAWQAEWLDVIEIAKNREEYAIDGKISVDEVYKDPESNACNDASFIAVIPTSIRRKIESNGENLIDYYIRLADLFPIYKISDENDEECNSKYKFKVVVRDNNLSIGNCIPSGQTQHIGTLIWDSVSCFDSYESAICAYQYFYRLAGTSNNCRILCENGKFRINLIEVLAESSCEFTTEEQAWDDQFPRKVDTCKDCVPGGVREFVYAADDEKNYIPYCDQKYWKFVVVSPKYFVLKHDCWYNSEYERDEQMNIWNEYLKKEDWSRYITKPTGNEETDKFYPIVKTEKGYCYRIYSPENDKDISEGGLQPCGCEELKDETGACNNPYPFVSSNCYSCESEALIAFEEFKKLVASGLYTLDCISKTEQGPYSFQILDKSKILAYHPQQYNSFQEVKDAIKRTMLFADNDGMHLLEHILLRPKNSGECKKVVIDANGNRTEKSCLLPICPDYECSIEFQPDMEKDDPCAEANPLKIYYLPGSDPYSFWATVVLPAWGKRFRTEDSRKAFEYLLYKEVPALVGLNILWLSPRDMCRFEDEYKNWMEWQQYPKIRPCDFDVESPNCKLSNYIKILHTEPPCPSIPGEQGDCGCRGSNEMVDDDCCLPSEITTTIFWGECNNNQYDEIPSNDIPSLTHGVIANSEMVVVEEKPRATKKTSVPKKTESKTAAAKKKEVAKKEIKKETKKATPKKTTKTDLLALARQRKPKYILNIKNAADADMLKTKSYERTEFFLQNTPTVSGYVQLVKFFKQYSLQKDNNVEGFLILLKNATWHLFDKFILDQKEEIKKEDIESLKASLSILKENKLSLKEMGKEWKADELKSLANSKPLNQLKQLLK